ncbi:MAG: pyruvate ferredoxin oxidoreductase subunit gamma [Candidatus Zixiibacteriota bacterium]|nr:MAG: pyruvate ferredoxin oxidoreductase subunit gamma [candidate division Zixibacteria bacterium]
MKEIRIHGRGGQGVVTAAELMAVAAFEDGKYAQAFPSFGSERMGAPVQSFVRIADHKVRSRSQIYEPDYLIVQDNTLIGAIDVLAGLKDDGMVLVDTEKQPEELGLKTSAEVRTIPATKIALEMIGRAVQNTTLMGAFSGITGLISVDAIIKSVKERFPGEVGEKNARAIQKAYDLMSVIDRSASGGKGGQRD